MTNSDSTVSRRTVLELTGASIALGSATGIAVADDEIEVNVGYSDSAGRRAALDAAVDLVREFDFDALTVAVDPTDVSDLESHSGVRYVEENATVEAIAQTLPWGVDRVDADVAHAEGETGDGADVAIIDTGIDQLHEDLAANLGEGTAFVGGQQSPVWQDDNGHGTHVAGTADAVDNDVGVVGVSTRATLHAVKVLSAAGIGLTSDVAAGIEWTADQGYDVGNMSLGGGESELLRDACNYAYNRGVLLVAAAGNSGPCEDCVGYPAAYETVVAVSATTENDDLADFSSTGPEVELAAPGADVHSTFVGNTYANLSGTSMAAPHVSGAGGQLMANGYTNEEARTQLGQTAEDIGLASNEQGEGLLDVAAALGLDSSDDGTGDGPSGGNNPPSIDAFQIDDKSNKKWARFDVDWAASDPDGDLSSVEVRLDRQDGTTADSETTSVGGSEASGSSRVEEKDGAGNTYDVTLTVTDANGNRASETREVTA